MTDGPAYGKVRDFAGDLRNAARQNPISAALLGMGLIWLFAGGAGGKTAGGTGRRLRHSRNRLADYDEDQSPTASRMANAIDAVGGRVSHLSQKFGGRLRRLGEASGDAASSASQMVRSGGAVASDFAQSIPDSASDLLNETRSTMSDLFKQQPLLVGAVGVAIGAGIAAAIPRTEMEASRFGDTSDDVKKTATDFASEKFEQFKTVAKEVAAAATEEARRQGLTSDELKSAAADLNAKAKRVAGATGESVGERIAKLRSSE